MPYLTHLPTSIRDYFAVLEPNPPSWLEDYIETPAMLRSAGISNNCGRAYTALEPSDFYYSNLDHSVGVALIIWHFTHDQKQTLAGLFHDIATPVFKHCVDTMNGDSTKQESLEQLTPTFIKNSPELTARLNRDQIKIGEASDYHLYPIADNDSPRLAGDRLEYSLSNALFLYNKLTLPEVREIYEDIEIETNEDSLPELGFQTKKLARKFVKATSEMAIIYRDERSIYTTQLIATILSGLIDQGLITTGDLYQKSESKIINIIERSSFAPIFKAWKEAQPSKLRISKHPPGDVFSARQSLKVRYIDPLVNGKRISKVCKIASSYIKKNLSYSVDDYVYLDSARTRFYVKNQQYT